MLRNKIISIVALAVIGLASPTGAFARGGGGGHGGGGIHGGEGGFHAGGGGFHGGGFGFRGGGFRGRGFGFFGPYGYGDYPYYYGGNYEGGCYLVTRRVLTRYGWRGRRVEVCDWRCDQKTRRRAGLSLNHKAAPEALMLYGSNATLRRFK
jgi:hypothetical protein